MADRDLKPSELTRFVKINEEIKQVAACAFRIEHRWRIVARDPEKPGYLIDTNEYLVSNGRQALFADPGGMEIFPAVFSAICAECDPAIIGHIFASHQDPDIISSLALWGPRCFPRRRATCMCATSTVTFAMRKASTI